MNKKIIISVFLLFVLVVGFLINTAKNEYLKDQIFIEINENIAKTTRNQIKVNIGDIICSGVFETSCDIKNLDFYVNSTNNKTISIVQIDSIYGNINFLEIMFNKINNNFKLKNFHFNKEFLDKREFNPLVPYDIQEMASVMKKYGNVDVDFKFIKNGIDDAVELDIKFYNELVDISLKTKMNQLKTETEESQDMMFENFSFEINKKEFNSKFFNILKEREPSYFEKYSEDFIYKSVVDRYKDFVETKFELDLNEINDFFYIENKKLEIKSKEGKIISLKEHFIPFFTNIQPGVLKKRDFKEQLDSMNLEYILK